MKKIILAIIFMFVLISPAAASKAKDVKTGNKLFTKGDYDSAVDHYEQALKKDSESAVINFDAGTGYYKKGDYPKAVEYLQKSLLTDDAKFREKAYYNLGNAFYKLGLGKEKQDINAAIAGLEQSLGQYENALKIDNQDADARYNYEIVKKELERLKKQKESQEQKKKQQEQQKKQQNQEKQEQQKQDQSSAGSQPQQQEQQKQPPQGQSAQDQSQSQSGQEQKEQPSPTPPEKNQEEKQEEQKNGNIENSSESSGEGSQSQPQQGSAPAAGEMSKQEAEQLLKGYQEGEEPQGLLNFNKGKAREEPVLKDW